MKQIVDQALGVRIGAPTTFKNMTVFPLMGGQGTVADCLTLDEALAQKVAAITEVNEGGSVLQIRQFRQQEDLLA
jgi:ARG and Rhodanese-Phosphatase-superfamily-associated Protein domain